MKTISALVFSLFATSVFAHSSHMMEDDVPPAKKIQMKKMEVEKGKEKLTSEKEVNPPSAKTNEKKVEKKKQP